jgi:transposase
LVPHERGSFEEGAKIMDVSVLGIDLGKTAAASLGWTQRAGCRPSADAARDGHHLRGGLAACVVAIEACCGAHHMGRALARQGHTVRLMSPEYVRPYVKAQKNDDRDAEAIAEAATRPTMRFVELKTEEQLDMQTLHRIRDQLVGDRTSLMNQIRSLLLERGHIMPQGRAKLAALLEEMLDDNAPVLSPRIHRLVSDMRLRWTAIDERIADLDAEFTDAARTDARVRRLLTIPGIGALNATALVAAVGDARTFGRGRDLSAWLGLVPWQATTGVVSQDVV